MPRDGSRPPAAGDRCTALPLAVPRLGMGLQVHALRDAGAQLDPFLSIDLFRIGRAAFAPHPHAGFSAVTYVFDDSPTGLLNRDSQGREGPIHPGDLLWTLAGSGLMHEERPLEPGRAAHGLQIFVNLPQAERLQPPRALALAGADMPRVSGPGWSGIVAFGAALGATAPLALPVEAGLAVLRLDDGACLDADRLAPRHAAHAATPDERTRLVLVVDGPGALVVDDPGHPPLRTVPPGALRLAAHSRLRAHGAIRIALFSGRPLGEPVVQHGPFVMGNEGQIVDAMRRYQAGEMGRLMPFAPRR